MYLSVTHSARQFYSTHPYQEIKTRTHTHIKTPGWTHTHAQTYIDMATQCWYVIKKWKKIKGESDEEKWRTAADGYCDEEEWLTKWRESQHKECNR